MDRRLAAVLALTLSGLALSAVPRSGGAGPTYVEGFVSGDWTPEASPYILLGNATVREADALTIHPGVEVRFNRGTGLAVWGTLRVEGVPGAEVRFTANATAADHGFWRGIHAQAGSAVSLSGAVVEYAESGLTMFQSTATIARSSFSTNLRGLSVHGGVVTVEDTSVAESAQSGVLAREGASVVFRRGLLSGNRVQVDLGAAEALVENTTFLPGPMTVADAYLDFGSVARVRASAREGLIKVLDGASRVEVEGILRVAVRDAHGSPVAGARVLVEDNGNSTWSVAAETNAMGFVPGLVVTERRMYAASPVDYNPFRATAQAGGSAAGADVVVHGLTEIALTLPADLTPPVPVAPRGFTVDEDTPVTFDASSSYDNDPDLATTGSFLWRFPSLGLELAGITATYAFDTPGLYEGVLTVTDAAGNDASLTFVVRVYDRTPPTIADVQAPARGIVGETLTFAAAATDNDPTFGTRATYVWRFESGAARVERSGPSVEFAFDRAGIWSVTLTVTDPDGNAAARELAVEIAAPPTGSDPWPWIGGGAALLVAAIGLATERGKIGLLTLLLPLYTRIKDEEVLDQFTRGQIFGYIRVHPGDTYTDIKRNLGLNNGTLTYHLDVLEKQGLVRSVVRGQRKMFYPVDVRPPEDGGGLHEVQRRILKGLVEAPGIPVTSLAASLGISRQLALYHLRLLQRRGLVRLERRGVKLCGFAIQPQR